MTIVEACAKYWDTFKGDCSGFAKAVAHEVGVPLDGDANAIADLLAAGAAGWEVLSDGAAAAEAAADRLVIGGLRGDRQAHPSAHGHVVIVVPGGLNRNKYPTAWWGNLHGTPYKDTTINYAWTAQDRDKVVYAAHAVAT
ncbi:MAG: hypothetical protein AB7O80_08680 [Acetobacteraceae bacterium]